MLTERWKNRLLAEKDRLNAEEGRLLAVKAKNEAESEKQVNEEMVWRKLQN